VIYGLVIVFRKCPFIGSIYFYYRTQGLFLRVPFFPIQLAAASHIVTWPVSISDNRQRTTTRSHSIAPAAASTSSAFRSVFLSSLWGLFALFFGYFAGHSTYNICWISPKDLGNSSSRKKEPASSSSHSRVGLCVKSNCLASVLRRRRGFIEVSSDPSVSSAVRRHHEVVPPVRVL